MGLTAKLEAELKALGFLILFRTHRAIWKGAASRAYNVVADHWRDLKFNRKIREGDVVRVLASLLEPSELLSEHLSVKKVRFDEWGENFAAYVLDQCWAEIVEHR